MFAVIFVLSFILWPIICAAFVYFAATGLGLLAARFGRAPGVMGTGVLIITLLSWAWISLWLRCGTEPKFIPPPPGGQGEGRMIHACDGPLGMIDALLMLLYPMLILAVAYRFYRIWKRLHIKRPMAPVR
jgi:hypothetical protein